MLAYRMWRRIFFSFWVQFIILIFFSGVGIPLLFLTLDSDLSRGGGAESRFATCSTPAQSKGGGKGYFWGRKKGRRDCLYPPAVVASPSSLSTACKRHTWANASNWRFYCYSTYLPRFLFIWLQSTDDREFPRYVCSSPFLAPFLTYTSAVLFHTVVLRTFIAKINRNVSEHTREVLARVWGC